MNLRLLLPADEEFAEATLYYYQESPGAARRFKTAVEESLKLIAERPTRYRRFSPNIRVKVVRRFPYSIFYTIGPEAVEVLAIAHDAQAPLYWRDRV